MDNIKLMVCPHDTASNPDKWFHLAQFLSKNITAAVKFHQCLDFGEFHQQLTEGGLIYANPQDSLRLIEEHGYIPVVRSSNLFDEIVFIANESIETPQVSDFNGDDVVSVNSMMVTRVGVQYLFDNNIRPKTISSKASWMAVVKSIYRGEAKFALVYKDFYDGLTELTKRGLQTLDQTEDGTIYHSFLVAPELASMANEIQQHLLGMNSGEDRAKHILKELGMDQFIAVSREDILEFKTLATLGSEIMVTA